MIKRQIPLYSRNYDMLKEIYKHPNGVKETLIRRLNYNNNMK